ncbi:MAG: hypothetical protein ACKO7V_10475, partial [Bacteroidota bacterium]
IRNWLRRNRLNLGVKASPLAKKPNWKGKTVATKMGSKNEEGWLAQKILGLDCTLEAFHWDGKL